MSTIHTKTYTPEELLALPDSNNVELVDGQLVEKPVSALSALVETELLTLLNSFCKAQNAGVVLSSTNGIQCFPDQPSKVRKPDVSFYKRERFTREHLMEGFISIAPDLVAEVISTHDEVEETNEKVEEYLGAGVPLVWVIDPTNALVHIHRADGSVTKLKKNDTLGGENILPGFSCGVADLLPNI